jgi:biotin carboxylase
VHYNLAGAYDSNIALVISQGKSRADILERLAEILRCTELRGYDLETNLLVHYGQNRRGREPSSGTGTTPWP